MEMKVTSKWLGQRHFQADGPSGNTIYMDARKEEGGTGQGNRPMELLLMGLVGCTGIDIAMILERMRVPLEGLEIEAVGERREEYPQAFTRIHLTYRMTGEVPAAKAWRAIRLSEEKYCSAIASVRAEVIPHLVLNDSDIPPLDVIGQADGQPD
ncbi:OsmC family protein [Alicyclobacillus hesperidum URH17-3-68]|uniref:OsmC-like protein n=1 Tax=Alicyclobacillus hesperidum TaxID=89784 RepID=A0A1H2RLI9_9BACL|nr:OsmC family protein [Alicyclobacillus hesperidum]KRW92526.1 peroxiredoxin [Alicyclobacillus tengchongensis]EJY55262.1 OsmC family protein [Alicyclobacillus hesperidum URH17-3-68]SDW20363.1 putative redox protein [Alicyclobacillus hesperidum]GLG00064.1 OsmC-like protein [Alicyclobacillus hesperidum subsp. aegles]GLV13559.1 OsmC-like protein [Alicyclobacillus hesperidum]